VTKASALIAFPFSDYYQGSVWNAADQIFRKAVLFFPIGMVSGRTRWVSPLSLAGLAILLEVGQFGLPGRMPSVTDLLVEGGGAWAGYLCGVRRSVLGFDRGTL
jgi:VanZ family protein